MGNSTSSRRSCFIVRRLHSHITGLSPAFISAIDESTQIFTLAVEEAFTLVAEIKSDRQLSRVVSLPQSLTYTPYIEKGLKDAYQTFLDDYPEYLLTWKLDTLRRIDFGRVERAKETYVDYMGGCLYPESLVQNHAEFLRQNILGNTHSLSNTSKLSSRYADEARQAILHHFKASSEYTVVFTPNASAALKLVGEAYPFTRDSCLVIGVDSHNSVHGIRAFAAREGAKTVYIPSTPSGGFAASCAEEILIEHRPQSRDAAPSLFIMTGQSNVSNNKSPLHMITRSALLGYHTMMDAAALAPTCIFSLSEFPVDAMAISFYKMFGYPTGVGALIVKKSFLKQLRRPWFAGGTVDFVQAPGTLVTPALNLHEQFEDGTVNYLHLPAIKDGLCFLSAYLPFLPLRLSSLLLYLSSALTQLRHGSTGNPVVRILSKLPSRRVTTVGEQSDVGSVMSLVFLGPSGEMMPNSFVEYAATTRQISLRTGCMCNPGGVAAMLGPEEQDMMQRLLPGVTLQDVTEMLGREIGVVRISLGLASNFQDVWKVVQFVSLMGHEPSRRELWSRWVESR